MFTRLISVFCRLSRQHTAPHLREPRYITVSRPWTGSVRTATSGDQCSAFNRSNSRRLELNVTRLSATPIELLSLPLLRIVAMLHRWFRLNQMSLQRKNFFTNLNFFVNEKPNLLKMARYEKDNREGKL